MLPGKNTSMIRHVTIFFLHGFIQKTFVCLLLKREADEVQFWPITVMYMGSKVKCYNRDLWGIIWFSVAFSPHLWLSLGKDAISNGSTDCSTCMYCAILSLQT